MLVSTALYSYSLWWCRLWIAMFVAPFTGETVQLGVAPRFTLLLQCWFAVPQPAVLSFFCHTCRTRLLISSFRCMVIKPKQKGLKTAIQLQAVLLYMLTWGVECGCRHICSISSSGCRNYSGSGNGEHLWAWDCGVITLPASTVACLAAKAHFWLIKLRVLINTLIFGGI